MAIERGVDEIDIDELGIEDNSKEILIGEEVETDQFIEEMPDEIIGKMDELKGWFMAELEACNAGGIN